MKLLIQILLTLLLLVNPVSAIEFDEELSDEDKETFDNILTPVAKIYHFVKYAATAIAVLFLLFVGVSFITAGNDQSKRESAKTMATYVIVGLVVIWMAPIVVGYLTA